MPLSFEQSLADISITYRKHTVTIPDTCPGKLADDTPCAADLQSGRWFRIEYLTHADEEIVAREEDGMFQNLGTTLGDTHPKRVCCQRCGHVFAEGTFSKVGEA